MFSNLKLKASMMASLGAIIGATTLALAIVLMFADAPILLSVLLVVPFFLLQWLFAPTIVEKAYKVEEADPQQYRQYHESVERIARQSGIDKPHVMIADMDLPNAFAYGNFRSGDKVAITTGLLKRLEWEEVEAVIAHEIGHLKHNDSTYMMVLSILPALFLVLGRMLFYSSLFGSQNDSKPMILIAVASMVFYLILQICIMYFSRLREYYADRHSANVVRNGDQKLASGLMKISNGIDSIKKQDSQRSRSRSRNPRAQGMSGMMGGASPMALSMKPLLIADPDVTGNLADRRQITEYAEQDLSLREKLMELFSTHPNIKKRLRALKL
ncbi:Zn-dependent protease with chaperone function [Methanonatronarchaeum thermophilum]|uniref:Protease HtpX homolog n=1 Tax=Methanonatronarchaeum thermophilum TaxID=1927129 RepID=A0A1Y3GAT7_9EURY|nr:zinc metalloprotease HtpX [Methanonatronarchaeum thermophilum]OUJ18377.1 Zn-dependent protease with chaperone function [Methanonatronarchaeum thermophilum]